MSLNKRNPATYQKYDEVINTVLKSIAIVRTCGKFTPISYRDHDLKHMIKPMNIRVMRVDSLPTGSMAMESMSIEIRSYKDFIMGRINSFQIKYNQITNTVGFNFVNEYDRDFDVCKFVYQSDDMEQIKKHIEKIMYEFVIKQKLLAITGETIEFEDFTDQHITLLSMISI